jgi:hypothetical protein
MLLVVLAGINTLLSFCYNTAAVTAGLQCTFLCIMMVTAASAQPAAAAVACMHTFILWPPKAVQTICTSSMHKHDATAYYLYN